MAIFYALWHIFVLFILQDFFKLIEAQNIILKCRIVPVSSDGVCLYSNEFMEVKYVLTRA